MRPMIKTALVAICLLLGACASRDATAPRPSSSYQHTPASTASERAVQTSLTLLGAPYRFGARGPEAFDCSGLVYYAYQSAGVDLPRTSAELHRVTRPVELDQAQAGDLVFFHYDRRVSHVGIYLGDGRFVHAPSSGKPVSVASLADPHYRDHFAGAGRIRDVH